MTCPKSCCCQVASRGSPPGRGELCWWHLGCMYHFWGLLPPAKIFAINGVSQGRIEAQQNSERWKVLKGRIRPTCLLNCYHGRLVPSICEHRSQLFLKYLYIKDLGMTARFWPWDVRGTHVQALQVSPLVPTLIPHLLSYPDAVQLLPAPPSHT